MKHLTFPYRQQIAHALSAGCSFTEIGKRLGVHRSTVSREVERNSINGRYCPRRAQQLAQQRRSIACRHDRTIGNNNSFWLRRHLPQKNWCRGKRGLLRNQKDNRYRVRDFLADHRLNRQGKATFSFPGRHYNIQYRFCFTRQSSFCRLPRIRSLIKRWYRIHQTYWKRHPYVLVKVANPFLRLSGRRKKYWAKPYDLYGLPTPPISEPNRIEKFFVAAFYLKVMAQLLVAYPTESLLSAVACPPKIAA
ncbi:helix-turn-helix domain-containing protein [Limibacter armeniacum]|uniref:helix-turn-helix domain-containing protein n=1 Tax=Limibacter armeniacum TaxID=466084 RepID=UPI002FE56459